MYPIIKKNYFVKMNTRIRGLSILNTVSAPTPVENKPNSTEVGGCGQKKSDFCQFTEKWLELELSCKHNIFDPLGKLSKSKRRRF